MSGYVPVPPLMPGSSPQMQAPPMAASIQAQTASPNPILREIHSLSPGAKQALQQAHSQSMPLSTPAQPPSVLGSNPPSHIPQMQHPDASSQAPMMNPDPQGSLRPGGTTPPAPMLPPGGQQVNAPSPVDAAESRTEGLISHPSGISQIHNPVGRVAAGIGAELGHIVAPGIMSHVPGTEDYRQHNIQQSAAETGLLQKERGADTQNAAQEAAPELKAQAGEISALKQQETNRHNLATEGAKGTQLTDQLREHGYKADEQGNVVPLSYEEMSESQQAVHDLKGAQQEQASATAKLRELQADPNSPQFRLAQAKLQHANDIANIARERLGLSEAQFSMRSRGTDLGGNALPGAMLTGDENNPTPVGTAFQQNVRPTGQERNKADLANSAASQINDMKAIIQKHPDFFGPGFGQSTEFKNWVGSGDPDAKRFTAARTIAADHLAGTFGGRSEFALKALDDALGQFKENPKAALAGLDQLSGANKSFQRAGTVRTAGAAKPEAPSGGEAPEGTRIQVNGVNQVKRGGKFVDE